MGSDNPPAAAAAAAAAGWLVGPIGSTPVALVLAPLPTLADAAMAAAGSSAGGVSIWLVC